MYDHDLTGLPNPGNHWFILGESSSFMALFQVSELLQLTQIHGGCQKRGYPKS